MNSVKSNQRLSVVALAMVFMFLLISQSPANAQVAYVDNNVDSDSDQDTVSNKGSSASTSYLDAQGFDGTNETILETDDGRGASQIDENWTNYKYININHHQVTVDLTDFPVLVSIFDEDIKRNAQIDGDDIAFFDISGTQLSHEIETYNANYNATHAQLVAWVKSDLSSSTDTRLTMKYGNSTMSSQANPNGVWNSDYAAVWHLRENLPTDITDSTSNSNDGTGSGSIVTNTGKISDGVEFTDTSGEEISIPNSASLTISDTLTISGWIKPTVVNKFQTIVSKMNGNVGSGSSADEDLYFVIDSSGNFLIGLRGPSGTVEWVTPFSAKLGEWQYVSFTYNSSTMIGSFYLNGILQGTNNYGLNSLFTNTNPFYIGYNRVWTSEIFDGVIDEVKISNIVKSADWIATEYNNQNNPDIFHSVSNEFYYNDPWEYYKQITIDSTKVAADLNDFPVYILLVDSDLKTKAQTDGDDIAFFDKTGKQLAHEIITYNPNYSGTEAKLSAWIKADISSTIDTEITMKYGDSVLGSQENPTAVWSSNYNNVWHLEEDPSTSAPQIIDATQNNPGTAFGLMNSNDQVSGKLDGSLDFDGQPIPFGDQINVGQINSNAWTALTMSAWIYKTDIGDDRIFSVANSTAISNSIFALLAKDDYFRVRISTDGTGGSSSTSIDTPAGSLTLNVWHQITATWDSATKEIRIYVDGSLVNNTAKDGVSILDTPEVGLIGNAALGSDRFYTGIIDEVRLSNSAKSANWIATEYKNQNDSSTFYSIGSEFILDQSDPATSLIRKFEDPVDNMISNLDGYDNQGVHSNFNNERDKDNAFDTLSESLPNTHSLDSTGSGYMLVGGGSADWRSSQGTISFWVRYSVLNGMRSWGLGGSMEFKSDDADSIRFDWGGGGSLTSTTNLVTNKWYFFALTWNDQTDTLIFYIGDENNAPSVDVSTTSWIDSVTTVSMGTNTFLTSNAKINDEINGYGDELRYWDIDRNITELQNDYNKLLDGSESNLRSYYPLDNSYEDLGPDGKNGTTSGSPSFSSIVKPNFISELDLEAQFLSVPTGVAIELGIFTGTVAGEAILVDYWNGGSWVNLLPDLNPISWNNVSISNFVISNTFTIRFKDGNRTSDFNQDTWQIDAVILTYTNYQLEWEHQVQNVELTKENYLLTIYGSSSDSSEKFEVQIWNQTSNNWTNPFATKIGAVEQWYNFTLTNSDVIRSTITWRYRGDNETKDNIQNTLNINYAGIASYDEVPVFDVTPPDKQYNEGATGNTLLWDTTDANPNKYTIFRDEINITSNSWTNPSPISINVDGLLMGSYTYKIMVTDTKGHHANDTVIVTVLDGTDPIITYTPISYEYAEGTLGNVLNWTASDSYFDNYEIYNDTDLVQFGNWNPGVNINLNIDGLPGGLHNFTLTVYDTSGNSASDTVQVTVIDTTIPIIDQPSDKEYPEGSSNNNISWLATDSNAASYQIWNATDQIAGGSWTSGISIVHNIDGLKWSIDPYNFTIIIFDISGNSVSDTVFVTVIDITVPNIDSPINTGYPEDSVGNSIGWLATDAYPTYYEIYIDGRLNEIFPSWISNVTINVNIDGLLKGDRNITLVVYDASGNSIADSVIVTIIDTTDPAFNAPIPIDFQYSEFSTGNEIVWVISDNYPNTLTIYRNGVFQFSTSWSSGNFIINVDDLGVGIYNYTIVIFDKSSLSSSDTVFVTVVDTTLPIVTQPADITYANNSIGNTIEWIPTDAHPNNYFIFNDTDQVASGNWLSGVTITLNITGLDVGLVNYTITLYDDIGNQISDIVTVEITAESVFIDKPDNTFYVDGTTGNFLNWTVSDANPDKYIIYQNGSEVDSGTWTSGVVISWPIDGLAIDVYNFSIFVNDTDSNFITHQLNVTVSDMPVWQLPLDRSMMYFEGTTGNNVNWSASDMFPDYYEIYNDTQLVASGNWSSSINMTLGLDGLLKGVYNYTIYVYDTVGNTILDTFTVTVIDNIAPTISSPPIDIEYAEGTTNHEIIWNVVDLHPSTYEIWNSTDLISSGFWTSGENIVHNIDGLLNGLYNFTIILYDSSGNSKIDKVWVNVIDGTDPVFTNTPNDVQLNEGTSGQTLTWTAIDSYVDNYTIYKDGVPGSPTPWTSGADIIQSLNGLTKGTYNFTIVIYDLSGNSINDTVWVNIVDETNPIFTIPTNDLAFDEGSGPQILIWRGNDTYAANYIIYQDGVQVNDSNWISGVDISWNVASLLKGEYNFTIVIFDASGNFASDTVIVTVSDGTMPELVANPTNTQYAEGSTGNTLAWDATDAYANNYEIWNATNMLTNGTWISGNPIVYNIDGLDRGTYNFTIIFIDQSSNRINHTVIFEVTDETVPILVSSPTNTQYAEGNTGNTLTWDASDSYSNIYEIWNATDKLTNGTWISGNPIVYNIDGLDKGTYNFTIIFIDQSGNQINHTVIFEVTDETLPVIVSPTDISYLEGENNQIITWTVSDKYASSYEIYNGSNLFDFGSWTSGTISIYVNGSTIGIYIYTLIIYDLSGNNVNDTVGVQVIELNLPVNTYFPNDSQYSETSVSGKYLNWTAIDTYPGTYEIYNDTDLVQSGSWENSIEIILSLDGLRKGVYNYTIFIEDSSFNQVSDTVMVIILDELAPIIVNTGAPIGNKYTSGATGNTINWTVTDNYPDTYSILFNSVPGPNLSWLSNGPISTDIDGLPEGTYNYTIVLVDESGNSVSHTIIIEVADFDPPIIDSSFPDARFAEGGSTTLLYIILDDNPDNFTIYRDGQIFWFGSSWISGDTIQIPVDNLNKGTYNFTIEVFDTAGNSATRMTILIVTDETDPIFIIEPNPNEINYTEGTVGHSLTWTMSDKYAGYWELYQNDTILDFLDHTSDGNNQWVSLATEEILLDGFSAGVYNLILVVYDESGNSVSSSIILSVFDEKNPIIDQSPNLTEYIETTTNNILIWKVRDIHAGYYNITIDGVLYGSSNIIWEHNVDVLVNIDGLAAGIYNITIVFYDLSLNYATEKIEFEVIDDTSPVFIKVQESMTFNMTTQDNTLEWEAYDLHPSAYSVTKDDNFFIGGIWDNTVSILINIDGLTAGFYNFTIEISDLTSNLIVYSVIIRVRDPAITDTVRPEITLEQQVYEGDAENFENKWTDIDGNPITVARITVKLLFNSEEIRQLGYTTNFNGNYKILFNYTGLVAGEYYWVLSFEREGYQPWEDITVKITILPHTYTIELDVPPEITQGETYTMSATLEYNNNRSSNVQLSLNELIIPNKPPIGVEVIFTFELEYGVNRTDIIRLSGTSNENGIVFIDFTGADTTGLTSVLSIKVEIVGGESNYPLVLDFETSELPKILPGSPDIITLILNFVEDNVIVVPILFVLIITSIALSVVYSRRSQDRAKQLNRDVKSAFVELKAIKSIQSIIIQNDAKTTIYEEQVSDTDLNINLIGGMVTAFSSFLNELGKSDKSGFEMMEREGISITVHKGKSSIFIVISSEKLPFVMLNQIQRAQQAIESSFRSSFSRKGDVIKLTKKQVHQKFDLSSFKAALKYELSFNGRNIRNLLKEKSLSRALKQNIDYLAELPDTEYMRDSKISLDNIVEFYKSKGITERVSSRTIILAYQYNIFVALVEER